MHWSFVGSAAAACPASTSDAHPSVVANHARVTRLDDGPGRRLDRARRLSSTKRSQAFTLPSSVAVFVELVGRVAAWLVRRGRRRRERRGCAGRRWLWRRAKRGERADRNRRRVRGGLEAFGTRRRSHRGPGACRSQARHGGRSGSRAWSPRASRHGCPRPPARRRLRLGAPASRRRARRRSRALRGASAAAITPRGFRDGAMRVRGRSRRRRR